MFLTQPSCIAYRAAARQFFALHFLLSQFSRLFEEFWLHFFRGFGGFVYFPLAAAPFVTRTDEYTGHKRRKMKNSLLILSHNFPSNAALLACLPIFHSVLLHSHSRSLSRSLSLWPDAVRCFTAKHYPQQRTAFVAWSLHFVSFFLFFCFSLLPPTNFNTSTR